MLSKKSPSGAMFPYYYKNGELFGMHLDGYEGREDELIAMLKAEERCDALLKSANKAGSGLKRCPVMAN